MTKESSFTSIPEHENPAKESSPNTPTEHEKMNLESELSAEKQEDVNTAENLADESNIKKDRIHGIKEEDKSALAKVREKLRELTKAFSHVFERSEAIQTNIIYNPTHMYRCIGNKGYEDFLKTGIVRSKDRKKYWDVSFNVGQPAPLYMGGESGDVILEATPESAQFEEKINPYSLSGAPLNIPYRSIQEGELNTQSKIRIFRRVQQPDTKELHLKNSSFMRKYQVVFDNIGGQALKDAE